MVSTVMLGAHALHANGSLYSRSGTAMVAMMAKAQGVPVIVCCETYKFSDAVLLDSFMKNELGEYLDESAWLSERYPFICSTDRNARLTVYSAPNSMRGSDEIADAVAVASERHLQVESLLYDLTPHTNLTALVTEVGLIPATAVPTVLARGIQRSM